MLSTRLGHGGFTVAVNSRLPSNVVRVTGMCVTGGHGVNINSGVTNHRNGGNVISGIIHRRSVPFLTSKAPISVILGPLNIPSHVGVNRVFRAILNTTKGRLNIGFTAPVFSKTALSSLYR